MAVQMKPKSTERGEVEAVNDKGVRIAGQWWNFSRYHAVPHPYRDEPVELTVTEGERWIEALVAIEDSKGFPVRHQPDPKPPDQQAHSAPQRPRAPSNGRERTIPASPSSRLRRRSRRVGPMPSRATCSPWPTCGCGGPRGRHPRPSSPP